MPPDLVQREPSKAKGHSAANQHRHKTDPSAKDECCCRGNPQTCDDFRQAMADANQVDLEQFGRWYAQAGTPEVTVTDAYDPETNRYELTFRQRTPETPGSDERRPLHIPIASGLLDGQGQEQPLECGDATLGGEGDVIELKDSEATFTFENVIERPVPSLLRRFSAPVKLSYGYDRDQLAFLMANDADSFNRWDAGQRLATEVILELAEAEPDAASAVDRRLLDAALALIEDRDADPALVAEALALPGLEDLCQQTPEMHVARLHAARRKVREATARHCRGAIEGRRGELATPGAYHPESAAIAKRSLRNGLLAMLAAADPEAAADIATKQYASADNMTDRMAALVALVHEGLSGASDALADFEARFGADALTMDKWFAVQASVPSTDALSRVTALLAHPAFSLKNPNKVRSLLGVFSRNLVAFHASDGSGYRFLAEQVLALDAMNPQVAARLGSAFNQWRRLPEDAKALARGELERMRSTGKLSSDLGEIVTKALAKAS